MKPIIGRILKDVREWRGLTQAELNVRSGVSKDTISRIEREKQTGKAQQTRKRLASALDVTPEVLTGEEDPPQNDANTGKEWLDQQRRPLNVRIDGEARNAFTLAAKRYAIPVERIVELAPFLFVVAAERSLERRRIRLNALNIALDQVDTAADSIMHLPRTIGSNPKAPEAIDAEEQSIANRDILADGLVFRWGEAAHRFDTDAENPFIRSLQEDASEPAVATVTNLSRDDVRIRVCSAEAMQLAGGDKVLASKILDGWATIDDMPPDLLDDHAITDRLAWLRARATANEETSKLAWSRILGFSVSDEGAVS
jgi:transcriptional regulator with XRE-family HTH domain